MKEKKFRNISNSRLGTLLFSKETRESDNLGTKED
jgi:hypothetical protein